VRRAPGTWDPRKLEDGTRHSPPFPGTAPGPDDFLECGSRSAQVAFSPQNITKVHWRDEGRLPDRVRGLDCGLEVRPARRGCLRSPGSAAASGRRSALSRASG
jgi:hypothetical protein